MTKGLSIEEAQKAHKITDAANNAVISMVQAETPAETVRTFIKGIEEKHTHLGIRVSWKVIDDDPKVAAKYGAWVPESLLRK